jgi:hypothetical protein
MVINKLDANVVFVLVSEKLQFSRGWKWVGFDMEAAF